MKPTVIAGIVIAGLGAYVLVKGLSYGSQSNVLKVGDLQVSAEERRMIPPWVGAVAVVGGLVLIGAGVGKRRGA
jgi:drug/metabolite transporter (DMT)-like permease